MVYSGKSFLEWGYIPHFRKGPYKSEMLEHGTSAKLQRTWTTWVPFKNILTCLSEHSNPRIDPEKLYTWKFQGIQYIDDIMELPWNTHFSASFCCCWYIPWWCPDIPRVFPWNITIFPRRGMAPRTDDSGQSKPAMVAMVEGWFSDAKHGGLNGFKWSKYV